MASVCKQSYIQLLYKYGAQREFGQTISDNIPGTIVDEYWQFSRSLGTLTSLGRLPALINGLRRQGAGEILGRYLQQGECAERNPCHTQRRVERPRHDQAAVAKGLGTPGSRIRPEYGISSLARRGAHLWNPLFRTG